MANMAKEEERNIYIYISCTYLLMANMDNICLEFPYPFPISKPFPALHLQRGLCSPECFIGDFGLCGFTVDLFLQNGGAAGKHFLEKIFSFIECGQFIDSILFVSENLRSGKFRFTSPDEFYVLYS